MAFVPEQPTSSSFVCAATFVTYLQLELP